MASIVQLAGKKRPVAVYPTQAQLKALLHYDPETGIFSRLTALPGRKIGDRAGRLTTKGYRSIRMDGGELQEHRLAWLYVTGELPPDHIDHANHDRADNRFANLRLATPSQNQMNRNVQSNNACGIKGVFFHKRRRKWMAHIGADNRQIQLGSFETKELASEFYQLAADMLHGEFANYGA